MLLLFCIPMLLAERWGHGNRGIDDVTPKDALLLGVAQSIALIPGVSRSGITISTGMLDGTAARRSSSRSPSCSRRRSSPAPAASR